MASKETQKALDDDDEAGDNADASDAGRIRLCGAALLMRVCARRAAATCARADDGSIASNGDDHSGELAGACAVDDDDELSTSAAVKRTRHLSVQSKGAAA